MNKQEKLANRLLDNYSIINVDNGEWATIEELVRHIGYEFPVISHAPDCPKAKDVSAKCDCGIDEPYMGPCYGA